jgi:DUF1680 family protein
MSIPRREFLKTASVAAAAVAATMRDAGAQTARPAREVRISSEPYTPVRDYPIRGVRYSDVRLTDDFWKPKVDLNAAVTIPQEAKKRGSGGGRGFGGNVLEAAMLSLKTHPDPALKAQVDQRVAQLRQSPGAGNGGFEVAATWFHTTGSRELVDVAIKAADALYDDFKTKNPPFSGGERDAINCLQLYRVTGDKRHLDLAKHYLDIRGLPNSVNRSRHNQSYKPVLEQTEAVGHAVNGVTLMVSLADVGVLAGLPAYLTAAQRMWADAVEKKMYVTGGVGATGNEGFGEPYVLPNISAYAETCAVLMFMTLNHRLFLASGDGKYIDVLERGLYNNALSGVSASGDRFFYVNRLASAGDGRDLRWERASLECCPPNLVRFMASMPGYVYAQSPNGAIYVNLYVSSETTFTVGAQTVGLSVQSEMPWGSASRIKVSANAGVKAAIKLRVPGWVRNRPAPGGLYSYADKPAGPPILSVNGTRTPATPDPLGYVTLDRIWKDGDIIDLFFPLEARRVVADPRVKETRGRVAIEHGPLVYCAEAPDLEGGGAHDVLISPAGKLETGISRNLFGGAITIRAEAGSVTDPKRQTRAVRLIPYFLWANRGAETMSVWLPTREYAPGDVGPAGGFIFFVNPNYEKDGWRYLEAAPFDQSAGAKWGCFRKSIDGARGMAVGTGRQNTKDMIAACPDPGTAAQLCATLDLNGFRDWFLPSRDELALMYKHLMAAGVSDFGTRGITDNFTYWSSSQQTTDMANHVDFADLGRLHYDDKDYPRRVRAIRAI